MCASAGASSSSSGSSLGVDSPPSLTGPLQEERDVQNQNFMKGKCVKVRISGTKPNPCCIFWTSHECECVVMPHLAGGGDLRQRLRADHALGVLLVRAPPGLQRTPAFQWLVHVCSACKLSACAVRCLCIADRRLSAQLPCRSQDTRSSLLDAPVSAGGAGGRTAGSRPATTQAPWP
jgi:hypothetical protein